MSQGKPMHWYVNVQNQAYGPYSDDQMQAFVVEGRVSAACLISNAPENGYFAASEYEEFGLWAGIIQPQITVNASPQYAPIHQVTESIAPQPDAHIQTSTQTPYQQPRSIDTESATKSIIYLIMAEIRSSGEMAFLKTMQNFGKAQRVGDAVWLVRSSHSVEQLRNTLSQTLNQQDRLFIMVSDETKPAWFNIGADLDHRIRELWDEDGG